VITAAACLDAPSNLAENDIKCFRGYVHMHL